MDQKVCTWLCVAEGLWLNDRNSQLSFPASWDQRCIPKINNDHLVEEGQHTSFILKTRLRPACTAGTRQPGWVLQLQSLNDLEHVPVQWKVSIRASHLPAPWLSACSQDLWTSQPHLPALPKTIRSTRCLFHSLSFSESWVLPCDWGLGTSLFLESVPLGASLHRKGTWILPWLHHWPCSGWVPSDS